MSKKIEIGRNKRKYAVVLLAFTAFCLAQLSAQENLVQQIIVYNDTATYQYTYLYNADNKKVLEIEHIGNNGSWQNTAQTEWLYSGQNCTSQVYRKYTAANTWEKQYEIVTSYQNDKPVLIVDTDYSQTADGTPLTKTTLNYNANGLVSERTLDIWNDNVWSRSFSVSYTYTDTLMATMSVKDSANATWYTAAYTYTATHQPLQQTVMQNVNDSMVNLQQCNWGYDASDRVAYTNVKYWELTDAGYAWVNSQNILYEYANGVLSSETYQYWNSEYWQVDMQYVYSYNADGVLENKMLRFPLYNKWRDISSFLYSYQSSPKQETIVSQYEYWGGEEASENISLIPYVFNYVDNIESKEGYRVDVLYYDPTQVGTSYQLPENNISIYPNPSTGVFYIDTQKYDISSWKVISLSGATINEHSNAERTGIIDISTQPDGIYLLQVVSEQDIYSLKLIKQ